MKIAIGPSITHIVEATKLEVAVVNEECEANDTSLAFLRKKFRFIEMKKSILTERDFPTGLLPDIERAFQRRKLPLIVTRDTRVTLPWREPGAWVFEDAAKPIILSEDQETAVTRALKARAGYVQAVTAFGKTEVLFALYRCLAVMGPVRAVLVTISSALHVQTVVRAKEKLPPKEVFELRGSKLVLPDTGLVVTTYDTLAIRLKGQHSKKTGELKVAPSEEVQEWYQGTNLFLGDEIHRLSAERYLACVKAFPGTYKTGVSGTPTVRNPWKNKHLYGYVGKRVFLASEKKQVALGRVAQTHVFPLRIGRPVPIPDLDDQPDYVKVYGDLLYNDKQLLKQIAKDVIWFREHDLPTAILVDWSGPGVMIHNILKQVLKDPTDLAYVDGDCSDKYKEQVRQDFIAERIVTVIATPVLGTGIDIPNIASVILAGTMRDPGKLDQQLGRGKRVERGEDARDPVLYVRDYQILSHPWFKSQAKARMEIYEKKPTYIIHRDGVLKLVTPVDVRV